MLLFLMLRQHARQTQLIRTVIRAHMSIAHHSGYGPKAGAWGICFWLWGWPEAESDHKSQNPTPVTHCRLPVSTALKQHPQQATRCSNMQVCGGHFRVKLKKNPYQILLPDSANESWVQNKVNTWLRYIYSVHMAVIRNLWDLSKRLYLKLRFH